MKSSNFAFIVNKNGIQPSKKKVEAMLEVAEPKNKTELQSWLGTVNYHHEFMPDMSTIVAPLTALLGKSVEWKWDYSCD